MHENHEEWIDSFAGIIPNQHYTSRVELGDEIGLIVRLSGDAYNVVLNFGIPTAVNFLDEGVQLNDVQRMSLYTELLPLNKFESVIYRIKNGRYARYIEENLQKELSNTQLVHQLQNQINQIMQEGK